MTINWVGWLLSVIVLLLLFAVWAIVQNPIRLLITGKRARGIVVGMDESNEKVSPMVEFVTSTGETIKFHGRLYSISPSCGVGDRVPVAYNEDVPRNAQILLWKEFPIMLVGIVLGFIAFILLVWISCIMVSGEEKYNDPFNFLPYLISHFHLNPFRFPILFLLSIVIPSCGIGSFVFTKQAINMRTNGIKVIGQVTDLESSSSRLGSGGVGRGVHPMVTFKDRSGGSHTIQRAATTVVSRLKSGDNVEVIYLPEFPDQGVVNTWDELWLIPLFFGLMTFAFLFLLRLVLNGTIWF
jgi:hypothetical protein